MQYSVKEDAPCGGSVVLSSAETWTLTQADRERLSAFEGCLEKNGEDQLGDGQDEEVPQKV